MLSKCEASPHCADQSEAGETTPMEHRPRNSQADSIPGVGGINRVERLSPWIAVTALLQSACCKRPCTCLVINVEITCAVATTTTVTNKNWILDPPA